MLFPDVSPSREEVFAALANALVGERTRIYLDASLLIHTYEISLAARDELFDALDGFGDRVRVPIWAARETWDFMRGRISRRPLEGPASRLRKDLDRFRAEALRYVDDDTVNDSSKEDYQNQLDAALKAVRDLSNRVANYEPKADVTTARLMPFIEDRRLNSDLIPILEMVGKTAQVRAAHNVPPGFADSPGTVEDEPSEDRPVSKPKGKQKNPNGDLIIWLEALADCRMTEADQLVVITRDTNKGDWTYKPDKIKDEQGRPQPNAGLVTLPSPLLVLEALRDCPKLSGVHIVSLEMLAHVLQRNLRIQVPSLAAALQSQARESAPHTITAESEIPAKAEIEVAAEPTFDSADMIYDYPQGDDIDGLLQTLSLEGWDVQNEAVRQMEPLLRRANRDQLVQIGRGLVGAANDGALEPIELLERVFTDSAFSIPIRSNMLIGILAEIFVAEYGDPKKPIAQPGLIALIYAHENDKELAGAYASVLSRLEPQRRTYLGLPTDHADPIPLEVILEGKRLRAMQAFGTSLLEEDAPPSRALRRSGHETTISTADLMAEISREFVVPASVLRPDSILTSQLQIPENIGYVQWGPNTGANLR
ncbi:PIN-like domain-containing protein [Mesorhizobium sp.]|uniref:PIN-like domain-containing protein n=1 Tax=Mesorhizobium sp. TaxID=1871066 RepID=UPI000FE8D5A3|nr:PIN-like domain-containing protein [Mesorhizobium sp.]RWP39795.1 MAG: hypothetical protein EOR05_33825 [Mesorhizobium sp.]